MFVELDLDLLAAFNLSPLEILQILQASNTYLPASTVKMEKRTLNVRTWARFSSLSELEQLTVGYRDNSRICLIDVARTEEKPIKRNVIPLSRGREILMFNFDLVQ